MVIKKFDDDLDFLDNGQDHDTKALDLKGQKNVYKAALDFVNEDETAYKIDEQPQDHEQVPECGLKYIRKIRNTTWCSRSSSTS